MRELWNGVGRSFLGSALSTKAGLMIPPTKPFVLTKVDRSEGQITFSNRNEAIGFFGALVAGMFKNSRGASSGLANWIDCGKKLVADPARDASSEVLYLHSGVLRTALSIKEGTYTFHIMNGEDKAIIPRYLRSFDGLIQWPEDSSPSPK